MYYSVFFKYLYFDRIPIQYDLKSLILIQAFEKFTKFILSLQFVIISIFLFTYFVTHFCNSRSNSLKIIYTLRDN